MSVVTLSGLSAVKADGHTFAEQLIHCFIDFKEAQELVLSNLYILSCISIR